MSRSWRDRWRTLFVRITGRCADCRQDARCGPGHGRKYLAAHAPDPETLRFDPMVNCDRCVEEYGTALGSITHVCVSLEERLQGAVDEAGGVEELLDEALGEGRQ